MSHFLGGVFVDRFRHRADLIIAVSLVGCGTANLIIPYSRHVEVLFVVCGVEGLLEAMINIGEVETPNLRFCAQIAQSCLLR